MEKDWVGRAEKERSKLVKRIWKLEGFISSPEYKELDIYNQQLLKKQAQVMNEYCDVLNERLLLARS